ncbi:MAG TPA: glycosyl hydrolase family 65 protein [Thermoleophilaceae bacterium]|nr:glycosyl hydrolase family 65 protein [Thermoleophilaceae bacterium]
MIRQPHCEVHPWEIREVELDLDVLAQMESVLALSNGHIGLRGNLDEGEPHGMPGTYLNGVFEARPLPYAEAGYGFPEAGQTVVNVTDGKLIRLLVDDEPFDVRYGELRSHRRVLDMRAGLLTREAEWCSPAGQAMRLTSVRLVSLVHRAVAAIQLEVQPLEAPARFVIQSELVANADLPTQAGQDPRAAAALRSPLVAEYAAQHAERVSLVHLTRVSGLRMAATMDHLIDGPEGTAASTEAADDLGRVTVTSDVPPGGTLRIVKFLAYGWSAARSRPAVLDQVEGALAEARHTGWDGLVTAQREALDDYWSRADVELDGDPALQQAVRFGLFHALQASARAERRAIPAKGLTGPGYDGHAFWDTETFVLPLLTYTAPAAARDALWWRHSTLPLARARAAVLGLRGATFPWRTIRGEECSGYWPAGTAAFHVTADVADAVVRYLDATEDRAFERDAAVELLVESARLWAALGHHDPADGFRIDGVTGPDEYSAIADNNVYTNLMAQRNLLAAADVAERNAERAERLGVDSAEIAAWRDAAGAMIVPWDERLRVHPQAEGFTRHEEWDFAATGPDAYPLLLHFAYFDLYRKQVVKQPDLVLALHLRGDAFTDEEKARDFEYYEQRTVRDSSLSACTQAVIAAEVGHVELAYDYFAEAALMDLDDLEHNTRDGVHIASLAGAWVAAVAGLGGMRDHGGRLSFAPRLPEDLGRLAFRLCYRDRRLKVEVLDDGASYTLLAGEPLEVRHYGERIRVTGERPVTRPVPPAPERARPSQPPGREPLERRRVRAETA